MGDDALVLKRAHTDYEEDVILEILARLPVKSLVRFRCVCKSWRALISDPYFVKKHFSWPAETNKLNFDMDPPSFLDLKALKALKDMKEDDDVQFAVTQIDFPVSETIPHPCHRRVVASCDGLKALKDVETDDDDPFGFNQLLDFPVSETISHRRKVVGSCDGLICVEVSSKGIDFIMLWNPCTRDSKVLPNPPQVKEPYKFHGFGYDSATYDYKVLRGFSYDANGATKFMIQIFALKTGSWKTIKDIDYVELREKQGLFLNGALHWLYYLPNGDTRILSFDLGSEKFKETIPLPYDAWFTVCTCPTDSKSIQIYMMKEYRVKESWTELVQFSVDDYRLGVYNFSLFDDFVPSAEYYLRPVCILENGVVLINEGRGTYEGLKEKKLEHFVEGKEDLDFRTVIYSETLVSPGVHTSM